MFQFLKGVATSGAWICFHDFDRMKESVLSVIAEQMLCISQAIRRGMITFTFNGSSLTLNPSCFITTTLNPGYSGRSELPKNLKVSIYNETNISDRSINCTELTELVNQHPFASSDRRHTYFRFFSMTN